LLAVGPGSDSISYALNAEKIINNNIIYDYTIKENIILITSKFNVPPSVSTLNFTSSTFSNEYSYWTPPFVFKIFAMVTPETSKVSRYTACAALRFKFRMFYVDKKKGKNIGINKKNKYNRGQARPQ
jgi:hypothetical protein